MPSLNPNLTKICLTLSNLLKNKGHYELILIIQNSTQENIQYISNKLLNNKKLKIFLDDGIGISRARNIGVKASKGKWILLLDDDVYIDKNMITNVNRNLSNDVFFYYGNAFINNSTTHFVRFSIQNKNISIWSYNRVSSISLIINKKVFTKIGFFDEKFGSGCRFGSSEESDFILRALFNNIEIKYLKKYVVFHPKPTPSLEKIYNYAIGGGALYKKHLGRFNLIFCIKFVCDLFIRVLFLLTFKKKRCIFLKGFFTGFYEYKENKK
jgi:GT2 family glycosyltransferase